MSGGMRLGRVFGIPLYVHYSWLAIFALVTVNLTILFGQPGYHPEWTLMQRIAMGVSTSLLFFGSVLIHELAHSLLAIHYGIRVENITLFIFGGASHISQEADRPGHEAAIAFVGPLASFILAAVFYGVYLVVGNGNTYVSTAAWWLGIINLALGIFNLLPGFPMDGGRIFRAAIWGYTKSFGRATRAASTFGRVIGFGLMVAGGVEVVLTRDLGGLWLVLIGWFLENAARSSYDQIRIKEALGGIRAAAIMAPGCPTVPRHITLDLLVNGYMLPSGQRCFVVMQNDAPEGIITLANVAQVPQDQWQEKRVYEVMVGMDDAALATPSTPASDIFNMMVERNVNQILVVDNGLVIGLVTRERLLDTIRARSELGLR